MLEIVIQPFDTGMHFWEVVWQSPAVEASAPAFVSVLESDRCPSKMVVFPEHEQ